MKKYLKNWKFGLFILIVCIMGAWASCWIGNTLSGFSTKSNSNSSIEVKKMSEFEEKFLEEVKEIKEILENNAFFKY